MLAILGSARSDGETAKVLRSVFEDVAHEFVDLLELLISPYDYEACYPEEDDFIPLAQKMAKHSRIVLATPVYWYAMSGVMKNFFDRLSDLITQHKPVGRALAGRTVYTFATGTDDSIPEGFEVPFHRTAKYFDMTYGGLAYIYTGGNDTEKRADTLRRAKQFFSSEIQEAANA